MSGATEVLDLAELVQEVWTTLRPLAEPARRNSSSFPRATFQPALGGFPGPAP